MSVNFKTSKPKDSHFELTDSKEFTSSAPAVAIKPFLSMKSIRLDNL